VRFPALDSSFRLCAKSLTTSSLPTLLLPSLPLQTPDAKKEEFRKYLEKAGVVDALTKGASAISLHSSRWKAACRGHL
jgi:hypothetical protein